MIIYIHIVYNLLISSLLKQLKNILKDGFDYEPVKRANVRLQSKTLMTEKNMTVTSRMDPKPIATTNWLLRRYWALLGHYWLLLESS